MSRLDTRLRLIERRAPPLPQPRPDIDYDRLSVAEVEEIEALIVKLSRKPNGRLDFSGLNDEEFDRLAEITEKAKVGATGEATR